MARHVTEVVPDFVLMLAVIVTGPPAATQVTFPKLSTDAIELFEDDQDPNQLTHAHPALVQMFDGNASMIAVEPTTSCGIEEGTIVTPVNVVPLAFTITMPNWKQVPLGHAAPLILTENGEYASIIVPVLVVIVPLELMVAAVFVSAS